MKKTPTPQEWNQEFQEFMSADPARVPAGVTDVICDRVHRDLNPSFWMVFAKVSAIHAIFGFVTLLFCPQFGLSLSDGMGLMALFMKFGDQGCMVGCGAVFMSGSTLTASLLLKHEEMSVIRRTEVLQIVTLTFLSMGTFVCAGVGIVAGLGAFWALGSIIGGLGALELGFRLRAHVV